MKRIGLLILVFMVFSAINGYGAGKKELSELAKKVDGIEGSLKTIQNNRTLENRVEKLEDEHEQQVAHPAPNFRALEDRVKKLEDEHEQQVAARPDETPEDEAEPQTERGISAQAGRRGSPPAIPQNILLERGQGYLTQAAVVDFMQKHSNSRPSWFNRRDISALVNAYFEIAKEEQVNHEIAIAQMWYATRELSHNVLLGNCNYAGLKEVKRGTFNGRDAGVRAHIQHLKGYASTVRPKNIVDPRYEILVANGYLGKGSTLEKLSVWWSADKEYETNIIRILNALYQYQYDNGA